MRSVKIIKTYSINDLKEIDKAIIRFVYEKSNDNIFNYNERKFLKQSGIKTELNYFKERLNFLSSELFTIGGHNVKLFELNNDKIVLNNKINYKSLIKAFEYV